MSGSRDDALKVSQGLLENYSGYYEHGPSEWRALSARQKVANIVAMCGGIPHHSVADVGAGDGAVSAQMIERGFPGSVCAFDISTSGVEAIRGRNLPSLRADVFDGYHIPAEDNQFDLAVASHVLEHVEHERPFIREAARIGKYLYVEVPLEDTLRAPRNFKADKVGHINFYNWNTVRRLLQTCDLEVLDQRLFDMPLDILKFQNGWKGFVQFAMRRTTHLMSARGAAGIFTANCGILCRKVSPPNVVRPN